MGAGNGGRDNLTPKSMGEPLPETVDLTISIVSYNSRHVLESCLRSIFEGTKDLTFNG